MRRSRPLTGAALAVFVVAGAITGLDNGPATSADTGGASTLYVDHDHVGCSDSEPGTQAAPFCDDPGGRGRGPAGTDGVHDVTISSLVLSADGAPGAAVAAPPTSRWTR